MSDTNIKLDVFFMNILEDVVVTTLVPIEVLATVSIKEDVHVFSEINSRVDI